MQIQQVHFFLAIVDHGSFSAAADKLYISQSSLSKNILALEKELGVQLFDRSRRKVALTPAGQAFLPHARDLNEANKGMLLDLAEFRSLPVSFSIVAIPVLTQYGITTRIAQFKEAYPEIHFTLEEKEGSQILPALRANHYDLGFVRDNYLDQQLFTCVQIHAERLLVMVSSRHPLASRQSLSLKELSGENFILFDKGTIVHDIAQAACRKAGFEPRVFYASIHLESIFGLVASNIGIAMMMEQLYEYYKNDDIVAVPLEEVIPSNIVLAHLKSKKLPKAAKLFMDFIERTGS